VPEVRLAICIMSSVFGLFILVGIIALLVNGPERDFKVAQPAE
jgi:hypothetical protein